MNSKSTKVPDSIQYDYILRVHKIMKDVCLYEDTTVAMITNHKDSQSEIKLVMHCEHIIFLL